MPRIALIPLVILAIAIVGLLALGIPAGESAQQPYEKTLDVGK